MKFTKSLIKGKLVKRYKRFFADIKLNKEIVIALNAINANVGFVEIESDKGHDSFLLDVPDFLKAVKNFLDKSFLEKL